METSYHEPDLHEPTRVGDRHDLRAEIQELHNRIDGLLEAVEIIAHDHYRPLGLPEAKMMAALHQARRKAAIAVIRLRD